MKTTKRKIILLFIAFSVVVLLGGCADSKAKTVIRTVTLNPEDGSKEYSIVYENGNMEATDEFSADKATFLYADIDDFASSAKEGIITVELKDTKLSDIDGNPYTTDRELKSILKCVADNAEHDIFDVAIITDKGNYYVFEKHNVNLQTPCVLYRYDTDQESLTKLCQWENRDLIGIAEVDSNNGASVIIGGSDSPTSIYLAPKTDSDNEKLHDKSGINDQEYTEVIDRVLNKYNFEPVAWNNTIDWKEDADILVKMAEDNKGRYKAYGIISKEAGSYGIVLIDTINSTDMNTNYIYERWFYTGNSDGEPKLSWDNNQLYFTYPVQSSTGYSIKTVHIDCGYDTGHMEFEE